MTTQVSYQKPALDFLALLGTAVAVIDVLLRFVDKTQARELKDFALLVVLAILVIMELSVQTPLRTPEQNPLVLRPHHAIPLLLIATGASFISTDPDNILGALLGGVSAWAALFTVEMLWRALRRTPSLDQGTLIAAYVAGLYVSGERFFSLLLVMSASSSLFYLPLVILGRVHRGKAVPVIPFLVLGAIIVKTPFHDELALRYRQVGHEEEIKAITAFIDSAKSGSDVAELGGEPPHAEVTIDYTPLMDDASDLASSYSTEEPKLVYRWWRSQKYRKENRKGKEDKRSFSVYEDLTTGRLFVISRAPYVVDVSKPDKPGSAR